ncbi:superinfection immunity protein [Xylophilus sp. GOD-11R]|uniref:superinfection immunity protein n=1 Tax=Xylophilus sp. GOD-11R TaxID=3089814 RepID=UPI00298C5621|nr:superinfection immunity protein [Xylophilus sp. GOD-11R]WPB59040.1 superinfection immunity protein [Xylophilus sp. GOD-11R]
MVFVRIIVLVVLAAFSFQIAAHPGAEGPNGMEKFAAVMAYVFAVLLYLLPIYEAVSRDHAKAVSIGLVDLLLGWTIVGWIVALVWALRAPKPEVPFEVSYGWETTAKPAPGQRSGRRAIDDEAAVLAKLRADGVLNDDEFARAKERLYKG